MVNVLTHRLDFEVSVVSLCLWILSGYFGFPLQSRDMQIVGLS